MSAAAVALAQVIPAASLAQNELTPSFTDTIPVSMTVSGGISRGVHQGGVNWTLVEFLRRSADDEAFRTALARVAFPDDPRAVVPPHRLAVATGASAGNINSILTALEWCRAPGMAQEPETSLFWQMWVRTGWEQLFPDDFSDMTTNLALLDRRYFDTEHLQTLKERLAARRSRSDCRIPVGLTTTKLRPGTVPVDAAGRISAATQRYASAFEVETVDGGARLWFREPSDSVFNDRGLGRMIRLPSLRASEEIHADTIFQLTKASSAFPAAFAPVALHHQDPLECRGEWQACPVRRNEFFLDGGAFDNNPLDLAYGLFDIYFPRDRGGRGQHPHARFIYIDPDGIRAGAPETLRNKASKPDLTAAGARGIGALVKLAGGYMTSSTQYELHAFSRTLARDPNGAQRASWIRVTDRYHPIAGNFAGAFAAFLGRPFREHDFYVGVYDGMLFAAREMVCIPAMRASTGVEPDPSDPNLAECTTRVQRALISETHLPLSNVAREALAGLYKIEYPAAPAINSTAAAAPGSLDERRLVLLRALMPAIAGATRDYDSDSCKGAGLAPEQAFLCSGGFGEMLRRFRTPQVMHVINTDAARTACKPENWANSPDLPCLGDETLQSLLENPERGAATLLENVIQQAWRVENRIAADRDGEEGTDYQALTEIAEFFYRTAASRIAPRGWDPDPSTVQDVVDHTWEDIAHVLPFYIGTNLDAGGADFGWRPTYHFNRHFAAVVPAGVNYRPGRRGDEDGTPLRDRSQWVASAGAGLQVKVSSFAPRLAFIADAVEIGPQYVFGEDEAALGWQAAGYFIAGKLRLGTTYLPRRHETLFQDEHWNVTLTIADANGILYWLGRSRRN